MKKFKVQLVATLPTTATMIVDAESEEAAEEYAYEHSKNAHWDGPDAGDIPSEFEVEVFDVKEIAE